MCEPLHGGWGSFHDCLMVNRWPNWNALHGMADPTGDPRRTILVVEPHLEGPFGHSWRYAQAFVERFSKPGWSLRILANRHYAGQQALGATPIEPVFARSYHERSDRVPNGISPVGGRGHARPATSTLSDFTLAVLDGIEREYANGSEVRILVPTATAAMLAELLAIPLLLRGALPRMALMFHEEPEFYSDWYRPLALETLRWRLAGSGWGNDLRCFATNARLAQRMTELLNVAVHDIGDVFAENEIVRLRNTTRSPPLGRLPAGERSLLEGLKALQAAGTRIAWCAGRMRPDKGADRLHEIVQAMDPGDTGFHLVLQVSGEAVTPMDLDGHQHVTLIGSVLSEPAYEALLGLADILLLPYDPSAYARRVSRVFQEAAIAGRPMLASAGISAESEAHGAAATFLDGWGRWPAHAGALIESDTGARPAGSDRTSLEARCTRWHAMAAWLTSVSSVQVPKPAALYVRPLLQTEAASWRDADLASLALDGCPLLELVVDCGANDQSALRLQSKDSVAQLTVWASRLTGFDLLIGKVGLFLSRLRGRRARVRDRRMTLSDVPLLIARISDRRGFSLIIVRGWGDSGDAIQRHFGLPDVPVRFLSTAVRQPGVRVGGEGGEPPGE